MMKTVRRCRLLVFAVLTAAMTPALLAALPASAQTGCADDGIGSVSVEITEPSPGERVAGRVPVSGNASSAFAVSRVELYADGVLVDEQEFSGQGSVAFSLSWDATRAPAGWATLQVVACGTGVLGQLARGSNEVSVEVRPPPTTTTPPRPTTTVPAVTTTVAAAVPNAPATSDTTMIAAIPGGATVTTIGPGPSTTAVRSRAPARRATTNDPKLGPAFPRPATLSEASDERSPRPPLWVGAVVGLSGTAGLVLSAVFRRRRAAPPETPVEAEGDLVQV